MKIAINRKDNDFSLSEEAVEELVKVGFKISLTESSTGNYVNPEAEIIDRKNKLNHFNYDRFILNDDRSVQDDNIWDLRTNLQLISVIEKLGPNASGHQSELKVVEIPDDVKWGIVGIGHAEYIEEEHRIWH